MSSSATATLGNARPVPTFSALDYGRFLVAGGLCATITHGAITPFDVVKTRLQLEPKGSKLTMATMAREIVKAEGPGGLLTGFGPTAVGYLIQGGLKFAGYEFFKRQGVIAAGGFDNATQYRNLIFIGGAAAAELIATTALTPLEAARIRMVSERGYAKGLVGALTRMASEGGLRQFYAGYIPILFKQIPYSCAQLAGNDKAHEFVKATPALDSLAKSGKVGEVTVQLGCGVAAGIGAAVVSHPADTLLSKINKGEGSASAVKGGSLRKLAAVAAETGFAGLWAGLGTRTLMTSALVAMQFLIYGQIKQAMGAPPGIEIAKVEKSS